MKMNSLGTKLFILLAFIFIQPVYAATNSIVVVDQGGVGQYSSMVLDSNKNPIISYYNAAQTKLKIMHCFEKNCGHFNSIVTPDVASNVGKYSFIALDNIGNPVVSYYDQSGHALKILHCANTSCYTGNTIATPDSIDNVGLYTAATVDGGNKPVVSYYDATKGILKVLHCGNAACTSANSIATPDLTSSNGVQSSIRLNSAGNPVVAYFDFTHKSLKILHCGNANCTSGNNIATVDASGDVGRYPSMVLGSGDIPSVSYLDLANGKLKFLRCGNTLCSSGNSITSIASVSSLAGYFSSLMLDNNSLPVVSFYDASNHDLNILRCGNSTCTSNNSLVVPDNTAGQLGLYTSLKLDPNFNPIVSYYDATNGVLKVLHCGSTTCNANSVVVVDSAANVGQYSSLKLDANGKPVASYWDQTNGHLKLAHCGNANCTAGNSITAPSVTGNTGWDTSLQLDAMGNPVVSHYSYTDKNMKVLHCNNVNCTGINTIQTPDILSERLTSMALDATGNPVIASSGQANQGLRIVHCGDATCSTNNSITSPDFPVFPFNADVRGVSLVLDASGYPVVSFYRADTQQFKILHCVDAACNGPGNSIALPDPAAQASDHRATSITLDILGNPVVAYQDMANHALKVLRCGNTNCTSGNVITTVSSDLNSGYEPSIKVDATNNPIISFGANAGMTVLHCGNATCTTGNTFSVIDANNSGWDSSLVLDVAGNPVVSYYNPIGQNLKIAHCGTSLCL